jgi:hypothetical protein
MLRSEAGRCPHERPSPVNDAALVEVEQPLAQLDCDELDLLCGQESVDLGLGECYVSVACRRLVPRPW